MAFYVTTPIYYVNGEPHLGHAYTTIAADAAARFHRMRGEDTFFLTGTDEHGQKIEQAASAKGVKPIELADGIVKIFRDCWDKLNISHDDFIRTTEARHAAVVQDMWRRLAEAGDIYESHYEGWYCYSCEAYYTEDELGPGNTCKTHEKEVTWVKEPSYFFRMSKYQDALLAHFDSHPDFVAPEAYRNEIVSFIKGGLRDLSVSRTNFNWGIDVPGAEGHVVYVWIDALTNYISALGGPDGEKFKTYWGEAVHIIGKDILRFHAVYWPCMLLAAGLPLPKQIRTHGWWTVSGKKISKSLPATRVDPLLIAKDLGNDAFRYYLLREVPFGPDGDFDYEGLIGRYHAELANDLGNLLNRTLSMSVKYFGDAVPAAGGDSPLLPLAQEVAAKAAAHYENFAFSRALEETWRLVRETNKFVDANEPWKLAKDDNQKNALAAVMREALEAVAWATRLAAPVLIDSAPRIFAQLGADTQQLHQWPQASDWKQQLAGATPSKPSPIFPRLDDKQKADMIAGWLGAAGASARPPAGPQAAKKDNDNLITFEQFSKLELKVGCILAAEAVPKTKKLLQLSVDCGEDSPRQIVAGIAEAFDPKDLPGKRVIVVANLKPAKIRGIKSEGMLLAVGDKDVTGLATVPDDAAPGTPVR